MSKRFFAGAAFAIAAFAGNASIANAETFACKCDAGFAASGVSKIKEKNPDLNLDCRATWQSQKPANETDTGDYSGLVKATFPEAFPPDSDIAIRIRPRQADQCVMGLYDAVNKKQEWGGINCNTSQNTSSGGFNIVDADPNDSTNTMRKMSGQATLTTKSNKFLSFYNDNAAAGTGKGYTLLAACVEPK